MTAGPWNVVWRDRSSRWFDLRVRRSSSRRIHNYTQLKRNKLDSVYCNSLHELDAADASLLEVINKSPVFIVEATSLSLSRLASTDANLRPYYRTVLCITIKNNVTIYVGIGRHITAVSRRKGGFRIQWWRRSTSKLSAREPSPRDR